MATITHLHLQKNSEAQRDAAKVGDPATILHYSDTDAATVIARTRCTITVQEDKATRVSGSAQDGSIQYAYERDPNGSTRTYRWTKRGWSRHGQRLIVGERRTYIDPTF